MIMLMIVLAIPNPAYTQQKLIPYFQALLFFLYCPLRRYKTYDYYVIPCCVYVLSSCNIEMVCTLSKQRLTKN